VAHGSEGDELQGFGLAEVEFDMELFFKKVGAALGVANVFSDIPACFNLDGDRVALKRCCEILDALAV